MDIKTRKQKETKMHEGHLYIFHKMSTDGAIKFWRCHRQRDPEVKCCGRLHTTIDGDFVKTIGNHTCIQSAANVEKQRIVTAIKMRAIETMETPQVVRAQVLQEVPTPVLLNIPSKNATKV